MPPPEGQSPSRDWLAEALAQDAHLARDLRLSQERIPDDEPLREAMISLDETLTRVTRLATEAHELVDRIDTPPRERASTRIIASAGPMLATTLALYAIVVDKLAHPGIAVGAVGLFFTKRVLDHRQWRG